jgi:3-phenylpropionate/trans-cinnamate dioxygenase ferredoxin subunit
LIEFIEKLDRKHLFIYTIALKKRKYRCYKISVEFILGQYQQIYWSLQSWISSILNNIKGEKREYIRVADKAELPSNKMIMVVTGRKEVLLANVDGSYYAIANKCTYAGGSLAKGSLDGCIVTCPRHGSQFDLKTGKAVRGAKIGFIKINVKDEAIYTVKVDGTDILVGVS